MFSIGDQIAHPLHGAGVIDGIVEQRINGVTRQYYRLCIPSGTMDVKVPVDKCEEIGIRPIIYMSQEGKMVSCGKEKGRPKAMERLITQVEELGDDIKAHRFYVGHTDAPELAQEVGRMLKARFGDDLDIEYVVCNPTAGSHSGPNGVGVCFHAKHR